MPATAAAGTLPAAVSIMPHWNVTIREMPLEDRIEKLARLALVALLFATLVWLV